MAKKKKRGVTLVALLLLLILLIAAYVVYDIYEGRQADKETTATEVQDTIDVLTVQAEELQSVYYKNDKAELTLVKNSEDQWRNESNLVVPLNSTYTDKMASVLESVTATKIVSEEASNISEYGFDKPSLTVVITKTDGSQLTILVGDESPLGDGYYIGLEGASKVYLTDSSLVSAYDYTEVALTEVATAPSITAENITDLLVEDTDKGALEITYEENNVYDTSDSGLAPYILNQAYDQPMSGDSTNIGSYLGNFTSLSYGQCVAYTSDNLSQYGLNHPKATISIDYFEDVEAEDETVRNYYSYTLQIGNLDEEQSVYYVKDTSSDSIYTMSQSTVEAMLTYHRFDLINKYVQLINVASVTEVQVSYDGEIHSLSVDHTTTTNEDGEEEDTDLFYLDKIEYEESAARTLYQSLISPMYEAEIPEGYTDTNQPIVATFTFVRTTESGKEDVTAEYQEYDDSFYTVTVNGIEIFLVDKRDIQQAITDFKAALNQ